VANVIVSGRQHYIVIEFCKCNDLITTLIQFDLWPASPVSPDVAFHIPMLNMMQSLVLECQVAVMKVIDAMILLSTDMFPLPKPVLS
jgi:hypothetical protein